MVRLSNFSVNTRILIPFMLVITLIAGISVFTVTQLVAGSVQERLHNQLVDSASAATNSIVDVENRQIATLRLMVFTEGVADAVAARDSTNLDLWLRPIATNARADDVVVFDMNAQVILHLRRTTETQYEALPPSNLTEWSGVQRVITDETDLLGDKFVDTRIDGEDTYFYISAPVENSSDQRVGGIALGMESSSLATHVSEQALSSIAFLTRDQLIETTFRGDRSALSALNANYDQLLIDAGGQSPIRSVQLGETNYEVLYSPFRLRSTDVGLLAVGLPGNFIVDRGSTSRNLVGMLFLLLFGLIGVTGLLVARTITNPIHQLVNVARAVREGDLSKRVGLGSRDELGELSISFDQMTDRLIRRNQEVQTLYQQQVQQTVQRDAVLSSISDAVIVQDLRGKRVLYNRTAEALITEIRDDEAQRDHFRELCRDPRLLTQPQVVSFVERHYSVLATPVTMDDQELIGYVIVFRDVTALIEAEQIKDEMMLQLSHELRTPLSAIRGYVELVNLIDGMKLSEQSLSYIDSATESVETLERMINHSIAVSQIISNRFLIEMETFNFSTLVGDVYDSWKPKMEARSLRLTLIVPTAVIWMNGDERRLREVLDQILSNAYHYTLPGGTVELETKVEGQALSIIVADSGVGIDEDELDLVFDRLYRGRSADAGPTDARGLGLGLYIARYIVHTHGGSITLSSAPQMGTIVTVELPLRLDEPVLEANVTSPSFA